jgi:acetyl esterase/lipase
MNKTLVIVTWVWLLFIVGCASPTLGTTSASDTTVPIPSATSIPPSEPPPTELPVVRLLDLLYVPEGDFRQSLDVYLPENEDGPVPTLLTIHGGGFRSRDKSLYSRLAGHLNELGYAVVSTNYRLTPSHSYPAQVEDVFCALAWINANSDVYGFDKEHIFVLGGSSGGYLAAMVGTVDSPSVYLENCPNSLPELDWIQGAVIFYGFYDFTSIDGYTVGDLNSGLQPYWGAEFSEISPEALAEMSPMSWVNGSEPPFLLIHGISDTTIPSWMSEEFATKMADADVDVELLLLDAGHAFELNPLSSPEMQQSLEAIEAFLLEISDQ